MIDEEQDIDPEDPDQVFLPSDRKEWNSNNPQHVIEHDRAQEAFEARRQRRIMNQNTSEHRPFGVLKEVHVAECTCSHCGNNGYDHGLKPGLNIPPHWWAHNAWYTWCTSLPDGRPVYYRVTRRSFLHSIFGRRTNQAA